MNVRCIRQEEHPSAATLIFAGLPPAEQAQRVEQLLRLVADGVCTPSNWYVAVDRDVIRGTLLTQQLPTSSAIFTPPKGEPDTFERLVQYGVQQLQGQNVRQATLFLDATDDDRFAVESLVENGFQYVTDLLSLQQLVDHGTPHQAGPLQLEPFQEEEVERFGQVIHATYEGSQDVPEALLERTAKETVEAYRQGNPTLPNWWIARNSDGDVVGVVLLAPLIGIGMELAYLGLVPKMRGKGYGKGLLDIALQQAGQLGAQVLTVTVDERNIPARQLYEQKGFVLYQSQRLYLWKSAGST